MIMRHEYLSDLEEHIRNTDRGILATAGSSPELLLKDRGTLEAMWATYQKSIEEYGFSPIQAYAEALNEHVGTNVEAVVKEDDRVKILLTCPECGHNEFTPVDTDDGIYFRCVRCGEELLPEQMTAETTTVEN